MSKSIKNNKKMLLGVIVITLIILLIIAGNIKILVVADYIALGFVAFSVYCSFIYTMMKTGDKKGCGGCCSSCSMNCSNMKGKISDEIHK